MGSLIPIFRRERPRCPFYGFSLCGFVGALMDSEGNQCALVMRSFCPCQMEWKGDVPDWEKCFFNNCRNQDKLREIKSSFRIFPREFGPDGISFGEWLDYIMAQEKPVPLLES